MGVESPSADQPPPLTGHSLSLKAYSAIRDQILSGVFRPGAALARRDLARKLGMSLLPVSEALLRLTNEGLVESRPRSGTRVRIPDIEEVKGRYVVREALECESAMLCCERATREERRHLRQTARQLDTMNPRASTKEIAPELRFTIHTCHMQLHMLIAEYARCPELKRVIESNNVLVYNWFYDVFAERRSTPAKFHEQLIAAITATDVEAARCAMREHVRYGRDMVLKAVAATAHPNFSWRVR